MNTPVTPSSAPAKSATIASDLGTVAILVIWALAFIMLLDRSAYGIAEHTARNLLLLWSASDQVPAPIVTLSLPDFRALFLAPAGILFSGSLLAAKCVGVIAWLAVNIGIYRWRSQDSDQAEPALLASGLALISPLGLAVVNTLDPAPFLLLCLLLGLWADHMYRQVQARFSGWYFTQLFCCVALTDLHPAGLAYPLMLALFWLRQARTASDANIVIPGQERTHMLAGIGLATVGGLFLAGGWAGRVAWHNPLTALGVLIDLPASAGSAAWAAGLVFLVLTIITLFLNRLAVRQDRLLNTLYCAWIIALPFADATFALISLVLLLHWGYASVLRLRLPLANAFVAQRGIAFVVLMVVCSGFLILDRGHLLAQRAQPVLSEQDELIDELAHKVQDDASAAQSQPGLVSKEEKARTSIRVASQWPGRTMLACRCNVLPLPPALDDSARFLANLHGIRYVIFDPRDPQNRKLVQSFSVLGGDTVQTLDLTAGGVLLALNTGTVQDHAPPEDAPPPAAKP